MTMQENLLVVRCHISTWNAWGYDKEAAKKVAQEEGREAKDTHVTKRKIEKEAIQPIVDVLSRAYAYHVGLTMPSGTDGDRLIPTELYDAYCAKMDGFKADLNAAKDAFAVAYPNLKKLAPTLEYPSESEIRNKFSLSYNFLPLPSESCIPSLMGGQLEKIRASVKEEMDRVSETAMRSLWDRMFDAVSKMSERLGNGEGEKAPIFRDSLVVNLKDMCDVLKSLNFTQDPELEAMRNRIETRLAGTDPDDIRKICTLRVEMANEAKAIVTEISEKRKLRLE